jgi:hypothetical protein
MSVYFFYKKTEILDEHRRVEVSKCWFRNKFKWKTFNHNELLGHGVENTIHKAFTAALQDFKEP